MPSNFGDQHHWNIYAWDLAAGCHQSFLFSIVTVYFALFGYKKDTDYIIL
jgi:hypothetical protein